MQFEVFRVFGEALALGLLIGSERYRGRSGRAGQTAGIRTFTIIALLGATSALLAHAGFTLITFGALVIFLVSGYWRETGEDFGLTTEMAALLTFWLGYLTRDYETLAISTGIVVVILLASKKALHRFVRREVSETEFFDTLKFLAVVFVVLPLLPNRYIGPFEFFNPTKVWMLIILISTISYAGYILIRLLGERKGLAVNALLGGLFSTTAVTVSLAERARNLPVCSKLCGFAGVTANSVQPLRLLFLVSVVDQEWGRFLAVPLVAMSAVGFLSAWVLARFQGSDREEIPLDSLLRNPFSLIPVLKFGLLFVGIFFFVKASNVLLGHQGIYLASAIAGLGSVSAITLSVADMVHTGSVGMKDGSIALLIALVSNSLMKWTIAWTRGTKQLALWLGGGLLLMLLMITVVLGIELSLLNG
jgi:uncharacterized membrane protein (DUF4010 family)